jgi:branched-subunit amino acid transport protein AzlD
MVILGTILTRALPFLLFPEHKEIPKYIKYLADILPFTIIGMLVVYCLKDISFTQSPYSIPEAISIVVIVVLHIWKKNTLLSIGGGALFYMVLVQYVFL